MAERLKTAEAARIEFWIGAVILALILLCSGRLWLITAPFPLDFNEGWNAAHAALAFGSGPLYPAPGGLTGNNYPPLSFYVVGGVGRIVGDAIMAGRIIALLSVLTVAIGIFAATRRFSQPNCSAPAIGALLFLGFNATLFRPYLAMNDPQWLGHAIMTAGLLCLIPKKAPIAPEGWRVVAAALLVLVGGMVKHNLLALPLAMTIWLAVHHRRALAVWLIVGGVALLLAAALCYRVFGPDFFLGIFASDREFSWGRGLHKGLPILVALGPLILVSARLLSDRRSDSRLDLFLLAAVIALPLGLFQRGGAGVDKNAHFEALIVLCIAAGISLARYGQGSGKLKLSRSLALLMLPLLILLPKAVAADVREFTGRERNERMWAALEKRIASTPGAVACQSLAACFRAGKAYEVDFFLYREHVLLHHDDSVLLRAIAERRFAAVQLEPVDAQSGVRNPLPNIFERYYRPVFIGEDGRRLLVPIGR